MFGDGLLRLKQPVLCFVDGGQRFQLVIAEDVADVFGLVRVLLQRTGALLDKRVELLRAFVDKAHGQRVALCLVAHLAKTVYHVEKHIIGTAEVALCVVDGHAELVKLCGGLLVAVRRVGHLCG